MLPTIGLLGALYVVFIAIVERLCIQADLPMPRLGVVDTPMANAFAVGRSPSSATVSVTTGLCHMKRSRYNQDMRYVHPVSVQTDGRGRILLPPDLREHIGLKPKSVINVVPAEDGTLILCDVRADRRRQLKRARGSLRGQGGSVDDLIAQRRAEAATEGA